jgi:hypothetical protein
VAPERPAKAGVGAPSGIDGNGPKRFCVQGQDGVCRATVARRAAGAVALEGNVSIAKLSHAAKEREREDRDDEMSQELPGARIRLCCYGAFRRRPPVFQRTICDPGAAAGPLLQLLSAGKKLVK